MSRRKDRERFLAMQRLNPDYQGFRGFDKEPSRPGNVPMTTATCSRCGRKRNVPIGIAQEYGDSYMCATCQEEAPKI